MLTIPQEQFRLKIKSVHLKLRRKLVPREDLILDLTPKQHGPPASGTKVSPECTSVTNRHHFPKPEAEHSLEMNWSARITEENAYYLPLVSGKQTASTALLLVGELGCCHPPSWGLWSPVSPHGNTEMCWKLLTGTGNCSQGLKTAFGDVQKHAPSLLTCRSVWK